MLRIALYSIVALLLVLMWLVVPAIYKGAATTPNELTGQVVALNNHGATVYVRPIENMARLALLPLTFAVLILGALRFAIERRKHGTTE